MDNITDIIDDENITAAPGKNVAGIRVTKLTVSIQRKINLGNYQSVDFGIFLTAELDPDVVSVDFAARQLWETARANIAEQTRPFRKKTRDDDQPDEEPWLGLPAERFAAIEFDQQDQPED